MKNNETMNAVQYAIGQTLSKAVLKDNQVTLFFDDGHAIYIFDDGQSCCESRYMQTDDDLKSFSGAKIVEINLKEAPSIAEQYGEHDVQFLEILTDRGAITFANHNEHNGYYGGFDIVARKL